MAPYAFSSPKMLIITVIFYIFLAIAWAILWHFVKDETNPEGKKRYTNFWRWWLGKENPSITSIALNWIVLILFFLNLFRIISTIIFGYAPIE